MNGTLCGDGGIEVDNQVLSDCMNRRSPLYDKQGEEHFNIISALHKSVRNSDPDAAVYWMCRMLDGGEDPLYIARRLVRMAAEDIGLADPQALPLAVSAYQAAHFLGKPECNVHLAEAAVYLAMAPKSNALEVACMEAQKDIEEMPGESVPMHIRNAPTGFMQQAGYGKGYVYAHDTEEKVARMSCLPDSLAERHYYEPCGKGNEARLKERLDMIRRWKNGESEEIHI